MTDQSTLAEDLNTDHGQRQYLAEIVADLQDRQMWGKRGLNADIARKIGVTRTHVGLVLKGKRLVTPNFYNAMQVYMGKVRVAAVEPIGNGVRLNGWYSQADLIDILYGMTHIKDGGLDEQR